MRYVVRGRQRSDCGLVRRNGQACGLSAPGRIRTCDLPLRRRTLYPLSYGRSGVSLVRSSVPRERHRREKGVRAAAHIAPCANRGHKPGSADPADGPVHPSSARRAVRRASPSQSRTRTCVRPIVALACRCGDTDTRRRRGGRGLCRPVSMAATRRTSLRLDAPRNNQSARVNLARDFELRRWTTEALADVVRASTREPAFAAA